MKRIWLILLAIALSGCTQPTVKPEPKPVLHTIELDDATKAIVFDLVRLKIGPKARQAKELDPFRRQ